MKIVYDLRYATDHFPGIGSHAHALLLGLLRLRGEDRFRVLWGRADRTTRFDLGAVSSHERVDWTVVPEPAMGWFAPIATGGLLRRLGGDVYLSPFYLLPVGSPMPAVLTLHDVLQLVPGVASTLGAAFRSALATFHARGAAAVITSSEFSRGELRRRAGLRAERLHVVPLGVPPRWEGPPERPSGVPDARFALVVGVNRPHKDLRTLAEAWRLLGESRPFELVGAGPNDPRFPTLADLAREVGAPGVHTLGAVSPGALEWLYANATLVMLSSRYEGFGLPLLEAGARGTPVIASDIPALREIGEGAVRFVPPGDAGAWAAALRELAADQTERQRLRAAGLERAARFDYAETARRVRDVLARVTGERAA